MQPPGEWGDGGFLPEVRVLRTRGRAPIFLRASGRALIFLSAKRCAVPDQLIHKLPGCLSVLFRNQKTNILRRTRVIGLGPALEIDLSAQYRAADVKNGPQGHFCLNLTGNIPVLQFCHKTRDLVCRPLVNTNVSHKIPPLFQNALWKSSLFSLFYQKKPRHTRRIVRKTESARNNFARICICSRSPGPALQPFSPGLRRPQERDSEMR